MKVYKPGSTANGLGEMLVNSYSKDIFGVDLSVKPDDKVYEPLKEYLRDVICASPEQISHAIELACVANSIKQEENFASVYLFGKRSMVDVFVIDDKPSCGGNE